MGRIFLTGIGPDGRETITAQAEHAIKSCTAVCGYDKYVEQAAHIIPAGTSVFTSGMKGEVERTETAVRYAKEGHDVCLICGGDPSLYSLASLTYQLADDTVEIIVIPGVTAAMAASALLGAPIADDLAIISMSDLLTPWEVIQKRIDAVNVGDFVAAIYNPKSMKRTQQIEYALKAFYEARGDLITGTVRDAYRENQSVKISKISDFDYDFVNMSSIVIVGCRKTIIKQGKMITPRGYPV
ncbi:precorrin-3B C(17)-methyltransferase [Seleniivibrio woodruffii]|uniref:precorrin-3B C(17)-methyltransferase n=1 Tax=Seleniivibrio woodruffii TaxID=1078050 RepID=UPI0026EC5C4B|nr:precorrin-3B C(17)-methyltransferase [Seleniivibrio woodruffii]